MQIVIDVAENVTNTEAIVIGFLFFSFGVLMFFGMWFFSRQR